MNECVSFTGNSAILILYKRNKFYLARHYNYFLRSWHFTEGNSVEITLSTKQH